MTLYVATRNTTQSALRKTGKSGNIIDIMIYISKTLPKEF